MAASPEDLPRMAADPISARLGPAAARAWRRLYEPLTVEEKIGAAAELLTATGQCEAVWVFEWLLGGGVSGKRVVLPPAGVVLLCDLLRLLPASCPLGTYTPVLLLQLRSALDAADAGSSAAAPVKFQSPLSAAHAQLAHLLAERPATSFRPTPEQAMPLFVAAAKALAKQQAEDGGAETDSHLLQLTTGLALLAQRALRGVAHKVAFKAVLTALPPLLALVAATSAEPWADPADDAAAPGGGGAASSWQGLRALVRQLLAGLFDEHHLEGFEAVVRSKAPEEGAPKKRQRRGNAETGEEAAAKREEAGAKYQATLFSFVEGQLASSDFKDCAAALPLLLAEYIRERRRHLACQEAAAAAFNDQDGGAGQQRLSDEVSAVKTPCEFCFFLKLAQPVCGALDRTSSEDLERCLVALWRVVRETSTYRPREDPDGLQRKALDDFVGRLSLLAVGAGGGATAWTGLAEALQLDPSLFEARLDEVWAAVGGAAARGGKKREAAEDRVAQGPPSPRTSLAVELLRTYARLADLPCCLSAAARALRAGPARQGKDRAASRGDLLADPHFLAGVSEVAGMISGATAAAQATKAWKALLEELGGASAGEGPGRPLAAVVLLEHFVRGLQPAELSLAPFRALLLRSFARLDGLRALEGKEPEAPATRSLDCLLAAFCVLGRRLGAWEMPASLRPPQGEAQQLAELVAAGLRQLASQLLEESEETLQAGAATPYAAAAGMWLALSEDARRDAGGAPGREVGGEAAATAALQWKITQALLQRGRGEQAGGAAAGEPRRVVCLWVPLLAELAARGPPQAKKASSAAAKSQGALEALAGILVPRELECWQYLAAAWGHGLPGAAAAEGAEPWRPAARLWRGQVGALAERAGLCLPVLGALASVISDTARDGSKEQLPAMLGLLHAAGRLSAVPLPAASAGALRPVLDGLAASAEFALRLAAKASRARRRGQAAGDEGAAKLLARSLEAAAQLLHGFSGGHAAAADDAGHEAAATDATEAVGTCGAALRAFLETAAAAMADGTLSEAGVDLVAPPFARLACVLLRRMAGRAAWLGGLVAKLAGAGLLTEAEAPSVGLRLPTAADQLADAGCRRSLKLLLALLRAARAAGGGAQGAVAKALRVDASLRDLALGLAVAATAAGANDVLAVLAEAIEVDASEGKAKGRSPMVVQALGDLAAQAGALVARLPAGRCEDGAGLGLLIRALCSTPWPESCDEADWHAWAQVVATWLELRAQQAPGPAAASDCLLALCASLGQARREHLVSTLAARVAELAVRAEPGQQEAQLSRLEGPAAGLAVLLKHLPQKPCLPPRTVSAVLAAGAAAQAAAAGAEQVESASFSLHLAGILSGLYTHLAAPFSHGSGAEGGAASRKPHAKLDDVEDAVLHTAGSQARAALRLLRAAGPGGPARVAAAAELLRAVYAALSALFAFVPTEGSRLPAWTRKPHVLLEVMKMQLEGVYLSASGKEAARVAGDVARLWGNFTNGGVGAGTRSAGRTGKATFRAKVQRATRGFSIMLLAHALDQQRQWAGVEAAARRTLNRLEPERRAAARAGEVAEWKDAAASLQAGLTELLAALDGSNHLKQSLYCSLRKPLDAMFQELNKNYQERTKYAGEA